MAVRELTFKKVSLGKWSENWSCYRRQIQNVFCNPNFPPKNWSFFKIQIFFSGKRWPILFWIENYFPNENLLPRVAPFGSLKAPKRGGPTVPFLGLSLSFPTSFSPVSSSFFCPTICEGARVRTTATVASASAGSRGAHEKIVERSRARQQKSKRAWKNRVGMR